MLRPYASVLRLPGAAAFSAAALVARFPMSMLGIGIVLLVSERTGAYGLAGAVSAAALVAGAAGSPVQARLADRRGQGRVLPPLLALHGVSLTAFLWLVWTGAPTWTYLVSAGLLGGSFPQIGAFVRARWAAMLSGTPRLQTAYALESVLDEVVFVGGPVLVTLLATGAHPLSGLGTTLVLTTAGGSVLAALRSTEPAVHPGTAHAGREPIPMAALASLAVAFVFMGGVFGTVELVTVAFADDLGQRGAAGPVLAAFAAGSMLAGIGAGTVRWRRPPGVRFLLGQLVLALALLPTVLFGSVWSMAGVLFVAGFAISPTLITGFSLVEATVPASRLTEGLAWVGTALSIGVALGAAVAGALVDQRGTAVGYATAVLFGLLAAAAAVPGARRLDGGPRSPAHTRAAASARPPR